MCVCVQTVTPAPGEHPLQYNYTFWYSRRTPSRPANTQSYEQNIRQMGTVASVGHTQFTADYCPVCLPCSDRILCSLGSGGAVLEVLQPSCATRRPDGTQRLSPVQGGDQTHVGGVCERERECVFARVHL